MIKSPKNIAVIGASGGIGSALVALLSRRFPEADLHAFSRQGNLPIDYSDENSIANAAKIATHKQPLDLVIVTNGILHDQTTKPEKSLKQLSSSNFHHIFEINTITPALIAKHFLPKLNRERSSHFAALSARVGSISDNQLGGWYAYRASKAALNMIIKNAAIEVARQNKHAVIVGLHPGTVDTELSRPFKNNVPIGQLFQTDEAAQKLLAVLEGLTVAASGRCFDWDGQEVLP